MVSQNIVLNGKNFTIASQTRLDQLLAQLSLIEKKLAVERNREIVPRSQFASTELHDGDVLEIIMAVGGG